MRTAIARPRLRAVETGCYGAGDGGRTLPEELGDRQRPAPLMPIEPCPTVNERSPA